jgi:hypothetical protein
VKLHRTKCSALLKIVISPALLEEIINELGTSGYSLILDESTDIATVKRFCYFFSCGVRNAWEALRGAHTDTYTETFF